MTTDPQASVPAGVIGTNITDRVTFCGPLGVGKTTAVTAAASGRVVFSEAHWSATSSIVARGWPKQATTVGIDYGEWQISDERRVALLGTPGQLRFTEARLHTANRETDLILWLFGDTDAAVDDARTWLDLLDARHPRHAFTVVVTRLDSDAAEEHPTFRAIRELASTYSPVIDVMTADARSAEDVRAVVLHTIDASKERS